MLNSEILQRAAKDNVRNALIEDLDGDIKAGDITAALIPPKVNAKARLITREAAILCGQYWANEAFAQIDPKIKPHWLFKDGEQVQANASLFEVEGNARALLTAERTALNFIQLLSGTATLAASYAARVAHTSVKLLDTRKTIPGLRLAQKYAVSCGGCYNHRIGLFDAYLIKENHIAACGSIAAAISQARNNKPEAPVEIEVENLKQLEEALTAKVDRVMLDNFAIPDLRKAVALNAGNCELEASGGITNRTLVAIAETGVDYISIGALTKDCKATDLSFRIIN